MALRVYRPMQISQKYLSIPVRILNAIGNGLLRLFRIPPAHGQASLLAPEEIRTACFREHRGWFVTGRGRRDHPQYLRFQRTHRGTGYDAADKGAGRCAVDMPKEELIKLVTESRHSRFPVYEEDLDHIVGILHLKDLIRQTINPERQARPATDPAPRPPGAGRSAH